MSLRQLLRAVFAMRPCVFCGAPVKDSGAAGVKCHRCGYAEAPRRVISGR